MSVNAKMTAIADAIRDKTGKTEALGLDEMAEGVGEVYEAGHKSEHDAFWDVFQNKGQPTNYYYHFSYDSWTDENYNPKYDIVCLQSTTGGMALFYTNKKITDTKVQIVVQGSSAQSMFANAEKLVTIRRLSVHAGVSYASTFVNCVALKNITMEGTIGSDIDFQYSSPLTKDSIESIINALSATASGKTVTFSKKAKEREFIADEWAALIATKPNWNISLV